MIRQNKKNHPFLRSICAVVHNVYKNEEKKNNSISDRTVKVIYNKDKIKVEIRKECVSHNEPHMHIIHTDTINASISLRTFRCLAGTIKESILKKLKKILLPHQDELLAIWNDLNELNNSVSAELKISKLRLPRIKLKSRCSKPSLYLKHSTLQRTSSYTARIISIKNN